ncbi:lipopolysaccharide biosynthesis protein [Paralcaligenes ginsengisoli]
MTRKWKAMPTHKLTTSLHERLKDAKRNGFIRSVSILVSGTAAGQALTMLVLPLLTRLYTPADFSILAVYTSLLGIIAVPACLRLDIAIPLPKHDTDAANILALALGFATAVSTLVALPVLIAPAFVSKLLGSTQIEFYLWLLPIGVLFASTYSALQFWATRKKDFSVIAKTRVSQAFGNISTQVGFGWFGASPIGLILGQIIGNSIGIANLSRHITVKDGRIFKAIRLSEMHRLLILYKRFPQYSAMEALANNASIQIPIIIIASTAAGPEAGFLALAMQVMQAPSSIIGGAIAQVYLSKAPEEHRQGNLGKFTTNILGGLMKTGVGPLIFAGIIAPEVFSLLFGEKWHRAGVLVMWMTPWLTLQFLTSPISMALHVTGNQILALVLQVFGLLGRLIAVLLAAMYFKNYISEMYAISGAIFYLIYLILIIKIVAARGHELLQQVKHSWIYILVWGVLGLSVKLLIDTIWRI